MRVETAARPAVAGTAPAGRGRTSPGQAHVFSGRTWLLCAVLSLAGCASLTPPDTPRQAGADGPLTGRMSVKVEGPSPRAVSAVFDLQGNATAGSLGLSTPLGSMLAQARWAPERVTLTTPKGETVYPDLDSLTHDVLGESVPVAALFDWMRARPWAGAPSAPVSEAAGGPGFEQLGWIVKLSRFGEGFVDAARSSPPPVTVRVRLD